MIYEIASIIKNYGYQGLEKVVKVAQVHRKIEAEVEWEVENFDLQGEEYAKVEQIIGFVSDLPGINIDPETRTRADLIKAIAYLEQAATNLKDEVADEAYDGKLI